MIKLCNIQNAAKYGGVPLFNVLGKIVLLILNNHINMWCESEQVFSSSQFGFLGGRSTVDAVLILHAIIQKVLAKNARRLGCVCIDYRRAFDTANKETLWTKLFEFVLSCKMTNTINQTYSHVQACVSLSSSIQLSDCLMPGEP